MIASWLQLEYHVQKTIHLKKDSTMLTMLSIIVSFIMNKYLIQIQNCPNAESFRYYDAQQHWKSKTISPFKNTKWIVLTWPYYINGKITTIMCYAI
jgi:hypothetical protein